jgi:Phage integrase family
MARHTVGPRRTDSLRTYVRATRIIGGLSVLVLSGAIAWDLANDGFWLRHTLFTGLVASLIVVAVTAAVLNEVLERRQHERWSVLAQYALFEFVRTARLVWSGLLELAGLVPDGELGVEALAAGSEAVRDTPRLAAAMDEMLASADRREQLRRLIAGLLGHGQEVLGAGPACVHAHGLRHAFAVDLVRSGAPLYVVRDALGHTSIATTQVYLSRVGAHEAVDAMRNRAWLAP